MTKNIENSVNNIKKDEYLQCFVAMKKNNAEWDSFIDKSPRKTDTIKKREVMDLCESLRDVVSAYTVKSDMRYRDGIVVACNIIRDYVEGGKVQ